MKEKIEKLCGMRYSYLALRLSRFWEGGKLEVHDWPFAEYTAWKAVADWMLDFGYEWRKPKYGIMDEEDVPVELVRKLKELYLVMIEAAVCSDCPWFLHILEDTVDKIKFAMCDYDGLAHEDFPDAEECARQLGEKELAVYMKWSGTGEKKVGA